MTNSVRLKWGLSLCKFRIPCFILDSGFDKQWLSTAICASEAFGLRSRLPRKKNQLQSPIKSGIIQIAPTSSEDVELALFLDLPKLATRYSKHNTKMFHARVSDPGMRFFVFVISVALSLAALSILKLHKLLEWLIVDSGTPSLTTRLQELQSKPALISEILRAAALRYTRCDPHTSSVTPPLTPPLTLSPRSLFYQEHPSHPVIPTNTSTAEAPQALINSEICFHGRGLTTTISEQCLLCLVRGSQGYIDTTSGLGRQRHHSESTANSPSVRWPRPSRPNAGICRAQVVSNAATCCLSVQMCSEHSPMANKSGLRIVSDVKSGTNRSWRLSSADHMTEQQLQSRGDSHLSSFSRHSPKLVACVAPTSTVTTTPLLPSQSSSSPKITKDSLKCQKAVPPTALFAVLEETEQELDGVFPTEEAHAMSLASTTVTHRSHLPVLLSPSSAPVVRCDCGLEARPETRDAAISPFLGEEPEEDDYSDVEGLELDDEGVYFTFDLRNRNIVCLEEVGDQGEEEEAEELTEIHRTRNTDFRYGEGLSELVALTNSISDDLLQLESGCQELIHRVHANRIELDRVNDTLSFVWDNKDECKDALSASLLATPSVMENSWSSDNSGAVFAHRYSPMGASFVSSTGSCCACKCHRNDMEVIVNKLDSEPSANMLPSLTLTQSDALHDKKFFHATSPIVTNDSSVWYDTRSPYQCDSLSDHCLLPKTVNSSHSRLANNSNIHS